ncbi:MAG: hypothetical protein CMM99_01295 [Rickettsiales bacterium]|nr:hypothetical protein [Rickettsiales bacterium]
MSYLNFFRKINYQAKILFLLLFDFFLILISSFLTEIIYLGYIPRLADALFLYIFIYLIFYSFFSYFFKVYKLLNRFFGLYYLQNVFLVISLASLSLFLFKFIFDFRYLNLNFIILQGLILLILITSSRVFIQKLYFHNTEKNQNKFNTIIFGAGSEGINLYRSLKINSNYNFVAFIDEDINKIARFADDLQIFSTSGIQSLKKKT